MAEADPKERYFSKEYGETTTKKKDIYMYEISVKEWRKCVTGFFAEQEGCGSSGIIKRVFLEERKKEDIKTNFEPLIFLR